MREPDRYLERPPVEVLRTDAEVSLALKLRRLDLYSRAKKLLVEIEDMQELAEQLPSVEQSTRVLFRGLEGYASQLVSDLGD